jgi:ketosteroid isomerase-like protein
VNRRPTTIIATFLAAVALGCAALQAQTHNDANLLQVRESVWRAFFANDTKALAELVPSDTISLGPGKDGWENQADILRDAADFQAKGGKLLRLEFPRTEIRHYGDVAVTYSEFLYEVEVNGKRSVATGRAMEVFVLQNGHWTNPGWHTDREP